MSVGFSFSEYAPAHSYFHFVYGRVGFAAVGPSSVV